MKHHKEPDKPQPVTPPHLDIISQILSIQAEDRKDTVRRMQEELDRQFCHNLHFTEEDRHLIMHIVDQVAEKLTASIYPGSETCIRCGEIIPEGRQVCPKCEEGREDK